MDKTFLNKILIKAQELKSSDIHISSNLVPHVRSFGNMIPIDGFQVLTAKNILDILLDIMDKNTKDSFLKKGQADFAYVNQETKIRYRVNAFKDHAGVAIVLRALSSKIPVLEESNYPDILKKVASLEKGLVLVCGPTGSGKSTTLAAIIDYINRNAKKHIITIEDPIEYVYTSSKSLINQREVGRDVQTFSDGLKGALREDPDVILIGEMRDRETIKMALTAAETGHLVFGTLHTMSASKTIDRIIDSVDSGEKDVVRTMLSTSLKAIILQTLLKKADGSGRVAAYEILVATGAIRNMIRESKTYQIDSLMQTGSKYGMVIMKDYIEKLIRERLVDPEEAKLAISNSDEEIFKVDEKKYYEVK